MRESACGGKLKGLKARKRIARGKRARPGATNNSVKSPPTLFRFAVAAGVLLPGKSHSQGALVALTGWCLRLIGLGTRSSGASLNSRRTRASHCLSWVRSDGAARRPDAAHRQRDRPHAAVLHHGEAGAADGRCVAGIRRRSLWSAVTRHRFRQATCRRRIPGASEMKWAVL